MQNPNIVVPLVYNTHTPQLHPLLSQILLLSRFFLSLLLHVFSLSSLLGDYWCGGALQCGAELDGSRGGEGEEDIIAIE